MAVVYHEIYLPIDTESTFDYIVIKQGDAGTHKVRATLISNNRVYTIPTSGASYFMKFRKPDNNYCLVEATVSDNTISAEVTEEMLRVSGTGRGEFMIVSGSNELKTATFHVKIVRQTFTSGDVQSHSDFAPFAALLQGAGAAASNANTAAAAANAAASLAEQKAQAIPDDYSELVADVAGKADKSTTYTKNEVDQMIEDVEVETDTTLAVSGAPADAAETGRQFGLIKADLGNLGDVSIKYYHPDYDTYVVLDGEGYIIPTNNESHEMKYYHPDYEGVVINKSGYVVLCGAEHKESPLAGLKLSIIGDSISTYNGYIPSGYATYYPNGNVSSVDNTWWKKLIDKTGLRLCVNASWSGSRVGVDTSQHTDAYSGASDKRIADLVNPTTQEEPDIIICYICTNDWGNSVLIGNYSSKMDIPYDGAVTTISEGYALMLYKLRTTYPDARVYCVTHLDGRHHPINGDETFPIVDNNNQTLHEVNHMIIELAHVFGAKVIDLETSGVHPWNISEYTVDGHLHPNDKGMALIAEQVYKVLMQDYS